MLGDGTHSFGFPNHVTHPRFKSQHQSHPQLGGDDDRLNGDAPNRELFKNNDTSTYYLLKIFDGSSSSSYSSDAVHFQLIIHAPARQLLLQSFTARDLLLFYYLCIWKEHQQAQQQHQPRHCSM